MKRQTQILVYFILIFLCQIVWNPKTKGQTIIKDSIFSNVLQETRLINIRLPESYNPGSDKKYEVIYLTDGEWAEGLFSYIYKFAQDEGFVPSVMIVTVPNRYIEGANQRDRDFLPIHVPQPAISGGADKFLQFFEDELIPYINSNYPSNGINSLYGHSYGGMFVMYSLLTKPNLFETYYATDPSFWWNENYVVKLAGDKLNSLPPDKILWIAGITETYKGMKIDLMDSVLQQKAPDKLHWKVATFTNEKHNSVRLKAMYDGIKYSYSGYTTESFAFHPMNGILMPDSTINISVPNFPEIRITKDGSEPTIESEKAESMFQIKAPVQLVVKSFSPTGKYDHISKGNFELGDVLPSIKKPQNIKPGGLKYSYYEGDFTELPDFEKMEPLKWGITDSTYNLSELGDSCFACLFEGYFEAENDGHYILGINSNDGSKLYINDKLIIDNDGVRTSDEIKSYVLPLEKGFYPVRIEYFGDGEGKNLQFIYVKPGTTNGDVVPLNLLYNQ